MINKLRKIAVPLISVCVVALSIVGFAVGLYIYSDDRPRPVIPPTPIIENVKFVSNFKLNSKTFYTGFVNTLTLLPEDTNGRLFYTDRTEYFVGNFIDGYPIEGMIHYENGVYFVGEVESTNDYFLTKVNGKLAFPNGTYYQGRFVNDLFEDENGLFSYHYYNSDDVYIFDYVYEGQFKNGTNIGLIGNLYYPAYFKKEDGLWMVGDVVMAGPKEIEPFQYCTYIYGEYELRPDMSYFHFFEGDGYFDGIEASYIENEIYNGMTEWHNPNGVCTYIGEYKNGKYNGKGKFIWDQDKYNEIESDFFVDNNIPSDKIATKRFTPYYDYSDFGLCEFTGYFTKIDGEPVVGQIGQGMIRYDSDNSVYCGGVFVEGTNTYFRAKLGYLDYLDAIAECNDYFWDDNSSTLATIKAFVSNEGGCDIAYFYTEFEEYLHSDYWINGDGVVYFNKPDGTPYFYLTGRFHNRLRVGNIEDPSKFDILPGYEDFTDKI